MAAPTWTQSQLLAWGTGAAVYDGDTTTTTGWGVTVGTDPLTVHYPVSVAAGEIAFLVVMVRESTTTTTSPGGTWAAVASETVHDTGSLRVSVWWRLCDGTEDDTTVSVTTNSGGATALGVIFTVSGANTSSPVEGYDAVTDGNSSGGSESPTTVTSGSDRLCVRITSVINDNHGSYSGVEGWTAPTTPTTWDYRIGAATSYGADGEFAIDSYVQSTAATVASTTRSGGGTGTTYDLTVGFAIIPASGASAVAGISLLRARMMNG